MKIIDLYLEILVTLNLHLKPKVIESVLILMKISCSVLSTHRIYSNCGARCEDQILRGYHIYKCKKPLFMLELAKFVLGNKGINYLNTANYTI